MLSGAPDYVAVSRNPKKKHWHDVRRAMDGAADIVMLDWMALKVDEFAVNNILVGDETVGEVLRQWRSRMPFNPALMVGNRDKRWAL